MISVWIMIAVLGKSYGSASDTLSTMLIDNIATQSECERMRAHVSQVNATTLAYLSSRCVQVWKVKQ